MFQLDSNTVNPSDVNASQVLSHKIVTNCFPAECAIWNFSHHDFQDVSIAVTVSSYWECVNAAQVCHLWLILWRNLWCLDCVGPAVDDKCPLLSVSVAVSGLGSPSLCTFFLLANIWGWCHEELFNQWLFLLRLISQASNCHDQCGYCTVADVCSVAKWPQLTPFCAGSLLILKLNAQLNTVLHAGAFSPQMADN